MKEKWQKPEVSVLSLKNTKDTSKQRQDTYEATRVKDGVVTTSTAS